jgi:hypothetical protein
MGINSTHDTSKDFIDGINITKGNKSFKCSCITKNFTHMQVVQNIDSNVVQCVIVVRDGSIIETGDLIRLPLYKDALKVENTVIDSDYSLFRKRIDYQNFRGSLQVALS